MCFLPLLHKYFSIQHQHKIIFIFRLVHFVFAGFIDTGFYSHLEDAEQDSHLGKQLGKSSYFPQNTNTNKKTDN